jgi:hypothetical protein
MSRRPWGAFAAVSVCTAMALVVMAILILIGSFLSTRMPPSAASSE